MRRSVLVYSLCGVLWTFTAVVTSDKTVWMLLYTALAAMSVIGAIIESKKPLP